MRMTPIRKALSAHLRQFREDHHGSMTVELIIVIPILIWAYLATIIFFDAFRARTEAQSAALNIADLISRQTNTITVAYLEGLNDVYDALTFRTRQTRLRISSISYSETLDDYVVLWSWGTRGLPALTSLDSVNLDPGLLDPELSDLAMFGPEGGGDGGSQHSSSGGGASGSEYDEILDALSNLPDNNFFNPGNMLPSADLAARIPQIVPGEALIVVEAFTLWETPSRGVLGIPLLRNTRLSPIAVTRPRFSPFVRFERDNNVFPEGAPEIGPELGGPPDAEPEPEPEAPGSVVEIVNTDFNDGNTENWSSDRVTHTFARSFFGPFGRETRTNPVNYFVALGAESRSARIEFDLLIIDSWDGYTVPWARPEGEHLQILVNGTSIATEVFQVENYGMLAADRRTVASRAEGRFTTTMTRIQSGVNLWGMSWPDQIWRVVIDIDNPVETFTLGFSANLDEDIDNESFAFENFRVTAERGPHGPAQFVPNAGNRVAEDPFTRFTSYSGCPDTRIAAHTLNLRNSDLSEPLVMRRQSAGSTSLGCNIPGASRFVRASPTFVVNYNNDTSDVSGNRLRIRTEDGNSGRSCDATLLVRDPFGQWSFNSEIQLGGWWNNYNDNLNARVNLAHAEAGTYHIWIGRFEQGTCNTQIIFERY